MKLFAFLPLIFRVVMAVEDVLRTIPGTSKKKIAITVISKSADVAEETLGKSPDEVEASVGAAIDAIVDGLNQAGVFTKAGPVPAQQ
jgi:hypothetical protein